MNTLMDSLKNLSSAEEFLAFFAVDYEPSVVAVNRLHILQRFHQYLRRAQIPADESEALAACRGWLAQAYQDFVHSTPQREKVFKVFHDADGARTVSVESLRDALPRKQSRQPAAA